MFLFVSSVVYVSSNLNFWPAVIFKATRLESVVDGVRFARNIHETREARKKKQEAVDD